jgi:hypothetical protein
MDNRHTFFNKPQPIAREPEPEAMQTVATEQTAEPPLPTRVSEPIKEPSLLSRIFSKVSGNATILQLFLLGAVFFLGNQFGSGCQKQKEVRQQIKMIEREHLATLKLVDSLQRASAEQEAKALKQVNDFYATLQQLDLKSEVVKTQLVKAKANIEIRQKEAIKTTIDHNETMKARINEGAKRSGYFDLDDDNSPTNN